LSIRLKLHPNATRRRIALPKSSRRAIKSSLLRGKRGIESENDRMPKFVIEREIPNVGQLTQEQLKAVSQTSCGVLREMGPQIQWLQSYVTDNKIYCVYIAPNEEEVRKHAQMGGFPANSVSQVRAVIDPTTSE
jgi:Protein of unknown function (DUF4242)